MANGTTRVITIQYEIPTENSFLTVDGQPYGPPPGLSELDADQPPGGWDTFDDTITFMQSDIEGIASDDEERTYLKAMQVKLRKASVIKLIWEHMLIDKLQST